MKVNLSGGSILVTGGAGFIGSNFIRYAFERAGFKGRIINYDKLTYAGNPASLKDVAAKYGKRAYSFVKGDVCDYSKALRTLKKYRVSAIVHFAAESHVDRSICGPKDFIETNVHGTFSMLEAARNFWSGRKDVRFHHISTDEVYGSLGRTGSFSETTPYDPRSPYSASKASSDHIARAYFHTYGLPVSVSNCSNNYGPYHYPEKLIPLLILNALEGKDLPVYGDGKNVRDWLYVEDHCAAVWEILREGRPGETYNVGGNCEKKNIDVVKDICRLLESVRPSAANPALKGRKYSDLITFVKDRPGHDLRYAINSSKIRRELGWKPAHNFEDGLRSTINWYLRNPAWLAVVRKAAYAVWLDKNYRRRK
ncbi:MAG: dTDP-glucose 4,6-dehydratase [Elusimicrobia bacterium GWA2_56_46]|nr:MAG: dTDP-glucose 4,6-dehydratase [Elusimicrobia bacterium GWA2_56_46]OGR53700.1 MAG: dTDP-glucose 4,6-dehydratase [Elusimicrobia bacterium GWC2_56_31]HBB66820.1 dTDP-glucose 4,6-dehydratase [Elusimicrobiota bacterium]HBW23161.1 dTDP-glucose 4,6-dehydratase [Elusimicrobiota bacterium]